jgi:hypothetical protein
MNEMRQGALLIFKEGVTPEEAATALEKICDVLDLPDEVIEYVDGEEVDVAIGGIVRKQKTVKPVKRPFTMVTMVQSFDPKWGWPVWYIP